jgi:hypothetical protein
VARAAAAIEIAAKGGDKALWQAHITGLHDAVRQARCGISELLQAD